MEVNLIHRRGEQPACERQRRASKIEASAQTWARVRYAGDLASLGLLRCRTAPNDKLTIDTRFERIVGRSSGPGQTT